MITEIPDISVVICFRDWGVDRLKTAVESHLVNARAAGLLVEVIVSDYGSSDEAAVQAALEGTGAKIVYTPSVDLPWNRSASLNAGVLASTADWVITTDADIVFTPATFPRLLAAVARAPDALYLVQCRDLPSDYGCEAVAAFLEDKSWNVGIANALRRSSIRPRWGMGGFAAFSQRLFTALNGYEERMKIWGGEDNDFATRSRRAGFPVRWLSDPDVAILHVWHEPSQQKAIESEEGRKAVENNRRILREDASIVRNLPRVVSARSDAPLVSVVIPTFRRKELLARAISSVRAQTFQGWELVVVENGDSNVAREVVEEFGDPRIRFEKIPKAGAAAARNHGVAVARGEFVVIHDDDDVMVSSRIEDHLSALSASMHGTYSGWIDFDETTFEVLGVHSGKAFGFEAVLCNGKVLTHGALMLRRSVFQRFKYEESLSAGIDYGFVLLLARNGLHVAHTGRIGILRSMHGGNMTTVDSAAQKAAGVRMAGLIKSEIPESSYKEFRARGISAEAMICGNLEDAFGELARLTVGPAILEKSSTAAGSSTAVKAFLEREVADEEVRRKILGGESVLADSPGVSRAGKAYLRFRSRVAELSRDIRNRGSMS